jgi:salicylate hydroxylase
LKSASSKRGQLFFMHLRGQPGGRHIAPRHNRRMGATPQLLIAGGGIGGLAAALAVSRVGGQARLFERERAFSEAAGGIALGPNATRILCDWGLERELGAAGAFPDRLLLRSATSGAELGALTLGRELFNRRGAPYATLCRADLRHMLHAAASRAGACVRLDHDVASFQDDGQAVTVHLSAAGKLVEGDALLGADGAASRVRQQLLDDGPPRPDGRLAWLTTLRQPALPQALRSQQITLWLGPRLHVAQQPARRGEAMSLTVIAPGQPPQGDEAWDAAAHAADLERATSALCPPLRDLLAAASAAGPWRVCASAGRAPVREASHMARGRVALLGEAAHPMPPHLAQNAALSIEDAAELAHALAMDAVEIPTRLLRYAQARWQRVARAQASAARNGRLLHASGPARWGRDACIRLLGGAWAVGALGVE